MDPSHPANNPNQRRCIQTARKSTGASTINRNDPLFLLHRKLSRLEEKVDSIEAALLELLAIFGDMMPHVRENG